MFQIRNLFKRFFIRFEELFMLRKSVLLLISSLFIACMGGGQLRFETEPISENANMWWARALADINDDGLTDVALQNNNAHGGWLGWLEANDRGVPWKTHIISEGSAFASGDLDIGDIDRDGDPDILGFQHPGEWDEPGAQTKILWYANPGWKATPVGDVPGFVKDVNLVDFNHDGRLDLALIINISHTMVIFRQDSPEVWVKVCEIKIENLHEGMDTGDIDGDGDPDIATNGYWLENPGGDLSAEWKLYVIDKKWNDQGGDWSANATKVFCRDLNADGRTEVFISHSERKGYPIAWYEAQNPKKSRWTEHIITPSLPATHTLQVFDFDGDGDMDVLTGVNKNRAKALNVTTFPVLIYLNRGDNLNWDSYELSKDGIYNGQVSDLEGDGDWDIFRLLTHDARLFEVWVNQRL